MHIYVRIVSKKKSTKAADAFLYFYKKFIHMMYGKAGYL